MGRKGVSLAAFAIVFLLVGVASAQRPLEFNGVRLGMSLDELRTKFGANLVCEDRGSKVQICQEEHGDGVAQETYVFNIYDGKLARANIWLSTTKYREVRDQMLRQFGKPSSRTDVGDGKQKSEVITWMRASPAGMVVVEQVAANSPDKTNITMNDDILMGELAKATRQ